MATLIELERLNEKLKRDTNFKELLIVIVIAIGFWDKTWAILLALAYLCFLIIDLTRILMISDFWRSHEISNLDKSIEKQNIQPK
jgi:hypothetical protein